MLMIWRSNVSPFISSTFFRWLSEIVFAAGKTLFTLCAVSWLAKRDTCVQYSLHEGYTELANENLDTVRLLFLDKQTKSHQCFTHDRRRKEYLTPPFRLFAKILLYCKPSDCGFVSRKFVSKNSFLLPVKPKSDFIKAKANLSCLLNHLYCLKPCFR